MNSLGLLSSSLTSCQEIAAIVEARLTRMCCQQSVYSSPVPQSTLTSTTFGRRNDTIVFCGLLLSADSALSLLQ